MLPNFLRFTAQYTTKYPLARMSPVERLKTTTAQQNFSYFSVSVDHRGLIQMQVQIWQVQVTLRFCNVLPDGIATASSSLLTTVFS
jgi:hypothetical protein